MLRTLGKCCRVRVVWNFMQKTLLILSVAILLYFEAWSPNGEVGPSLAPLVHCASPKRPSPGPDDDGSPTKRRRSSSDEERPGLTERATKEAGSSDDAAMRQEPALMPESDRDVGACAPPRPYGVRKEGSEPGGDPRSHFQSQWPGPESIGASETQPQPEPAQFLSPERVGPVSSHQPAYNEASQSEENLRNALETAGAALAVGASLAEGVIMGAGAAKTAAGFGAPAPIALGLGVGVGISTAGRNVDIQRGARAVTEGWVTNQQGVGEEPFQGVTLEVGNAAAPSYAPPTPAADRVNSTPAGDGAQSGAHGPLPGAGGADPSSSDGLIDLIPSPVEQSSLAIFFIGFASPTVLCNLGLALLSILIVLLTLSECQDRIKLWLNRYRAPHFVRASGEKILLITSQPSWIRFVLSLLVYLIFYALRVHWQIVPPMGEPDSIFNMLGHGLHGAATLVILVCGIEIRPYLQKQLATLEARGYFKAAGALRALIDSYFCSNKGYFFRLYFCFFLYIVYLYLLLFC